MIRPLLSLERLFFDESTGKVSCESGKYQAAKERMAYLEFMARATSHVPSSSKLNALTGKCVGVTVVMLLHNQGGKGRVVSEGNPNSPYDYSKEENFSPLIKEVRLKEKIRERNKI